mgnify:CR=1 FL=1
MFENMGFLPFRGSVIAREFKMSEKKVVGRGSVKSSVDKSSCEKSVDNSTLIGAYVASLASA